MQIAIGMRLLKYYDSIKIIFINRKKAQTLLSITPVLYYWSYYFINYSWFL